MRQVGVEIAMRSDARVEALEQLARDLARTVETERRQALAKSNAKVESLEQQARDLARLVETSRLQTLFQSDKKAETLEQRARELADFVETLRNKTRLQSETEIAALGQQARGLSASVEIVRQETLLQSDNEIAALGQQARDLAVSVEAMRGKTLLQSDTEVAAMGQQARDLALCVEKSRVTTLLESAKTNEESELRVLERTTQLEAANKELESFCYSISHDLRAPLRAIDGFSRIVLEDYAEPLPAEAKAYLKLVRDNTRQMGQLVDDLLAFSRLGRLPLTKQTVDPGRLVRRCLAEMHTEQEGRQLEIIINALPSCQADPTLLKQVWTNLLSNALKYTRKQEIGHIAIGCLTEPRLPSGEATHPSEPSMQTVYFVKDNGAGFDMKYSHKLFGVFQRLHRAVDYEGTGVGLAIVQRIINRHGGIVWGEARPNQGATFYFTLE